MKEMEPTPPPVIPQPAPPAAKPGTILLFLAGLAIFILGLAAGAFGTKFFNQITPPPFPPTSTLSPSSSPTPTPDRTTDWKAFTSSNGSVSHNYPESWVLTFGGEKGGKGLFGSSIIQWWNIEKPLTDSNNGKIQINVHLETITSDKKSESFLDCSISGGCSKVVYYGQEYLTNFEERNGKINSKNYVAINNNELLHIQAVTRKASEDEYKTVDQILSTFKFLDATTPTPTTMTIVQPPLTSTTGWKQVQLANVSFKIPADVDFHPGEQGNSGWFSVPPAVVPSVNVFVNQYDGGSRRQWWIKKLGASPSEVQQYMKFQDVQLGPVQALDVFADGGWWQGGYASPILVANSTTIVEVHGGRNFRPETGEMTRYQLSDTVASTIEFTGR